MDAEPGYFVDYSGSSGQEECPGGTYQPNGTSIWCIDSPPGTFSAPGSSSVTKCPTVWESLKERAESWSDCFIDSDDDGIQDYEDEFSNSKFLNNGELLYMSLLLVNIIVVGSMTRLDDSGGM